MDDDPINRQQKTKTSAATGPTPLSVGPGDVRVRLIAVKSELHTIPVDSSVGGGNTIGGDPGGSCSSHADERRGPGR